MSDISKIVLPGSQVQHAVKDKKAQDIVGDKPYDSTHTYSKTALMVRNGKLYKSNRMITTAEAWNSDHWDETSIVEFLNELHINSRGTIAADKFAISSGNYTTAFTNVKGNYRRFGDLVILNASFKLAAAASSSAYYSVIPILPFKANMADIVGIATEGGAGLLVCKTSSEDSNNLTIYFIKQNGSYCTNNTTIALTIVYTTDERMD